MEDNYDYLILRESLVLGIPVIDKQHANLVRIANNLQFACQNNTKSTTHRFMQAVREAIDFVRQHFHTEEKLMLLSSYPDYREHKREHGDFIWEILNNSKEFQDGQNFLPQKFVRFLNEWIKYHIGVSDKAFADFFITVNKTGKLRMVLADKPEVSTQSA